MSTTGRPPNYYAILEVVEGATATQIRDAYKRAALKTHPDRVPAESPERAERTRRFQLVNDAYYTLSDPTRRRDYDAQRKLFPGSSRARPSPHMPGGFTSDPFAEAEADAGNANTGNGNAYSWAWNFFTGQQQNQGGDATREQAEDEQFADVFEEMLREEGMADPASRPTGKFWGMLGGISGGALGFIVANVPGLLAGAVAGNRLGAVRDAKGKSVYAVFQELPQDDRARLLTQLATKVFSSAVGL
ncbi:DnaJ chaperone [Schizothecium vesticola]|uniref:DnaJ chaperone n=1 Tax=Schizothecium vesticola TaxID=314040 RepID=A0AA40F5W8_9PEZI|nr:DnaJ chaperone [Schizothecium vesticola]